MNVILRQNDDIKPHADGILYLTSREVPSGIMERALRTLKGVEKVSINHFAGTVWIAYDPTKVTPREIREFLKELKP